MSKKTVLQYTQILFALAQETKKSDIEKMLDVYTNYLRSERVLYLLPNIVQSFEQHHEEWKEGVKAIVTTARTFDEKELKEISSVLGKDVHYTHKIDETLLGGFIAQTKTLHIDASLKQSLNRLQTHLVS